MRTIVLAVLFALAMPGAASASHAWGEHQRDRDVTVADCTSGRGMPFAAAIWSRSAVPDVRLVPCSARADVRARTTTQGRNGYFGWADWLVDGRNHMYRNVIRFNSSYPQTRGQRRSTACMLVGQSLGLRHRGARANSCMNNSTSRSPLYPDAHDYEQLRRIYRHRH